LQKKFRKSLENPVLGLKTAVSKNSKLTKISEFVLFQTFQKLQKMMLNLNFENCKKHIPTQKTTQMFDLKFGMQGLTYYILT
jgi:hypothetical protein